MDNPASQTRDTSSYTIQAALIFRRSTFTFRPGFYAGTAGNACIAVGLAITTTNGVILHSTHTVLNFRTFTIPCYSGFGAFAGGHYK